MSRPVSRLVLVGTITASVLLGLTVRADATSRNTQRPEHMLSARSESAAATVDATLPTGFQESTVFSGLTFPTNFRFSPDGRVFVAEKSGKIEVFDSLDDTTPTLFADLSDEVDDYWDRGLLGLALDPNFPESPYVYVLYAYDAPPGQAAPVWNDACPTPPGPTTDGCVVTARLSRLTVSGDTMTGEEQVMVAGWCQQYPSHSIGDLQFGPDGALYVSGGDGANFVNADDGQWGGTLPDSTDPITPKNPCDDPPAGIGHDESSPTAEGGALRSQSLHRAAGPAVLNGAVLRVNPSTGDAMPGNPRAGSSDPVARRIVAEGLRNPFRFALRPGTDDLWIGDVGWNDWEEIDRNPTPKTSVANFGWPCYEGDGRQPAYESFLLDICTNLYDLEGSDDSSEVRSPYFAYNHDDSVVAGDGCTTGSSSVSGMAFYESGTYPSSYSGALFFADHSRNCIWVMPEGSDGLPDPGEIAPFLAPAAGPVDLEIGPGGDLFYAGFDDGTIRRIQYFSGNQPPVVHASATPESGIVPLTVSFDASGSTDPDGDPLTYSWDLDGDGTFGDSTEASPTFEYDTVGTFHPSVRVSDDQGGTTRSSLFTISAGDTPPVPVIDTPLSTLTWKVGQSIAFSGHATDDEDGSEPPENLTWSLIIHHCPSNCHTHDIQTMPGTASGSFAAPDHEYPSYLELKLTARDADGLSASTSVDLQPKTVALTMRSNPPGLQLSINTFSGTAPFTRTVIVGSANSISTTDQVVNDIPYTFSSWSDQRAAAHNVTAPATATTYTATFVWPEHPPVAKFSAKPTKGKTPLKVAFDADRSQDPDGDTLTYSWDLNGDGLFGDSRSTDTKHVYRHRGEYKVRLRVSDGRGGIDTAAITVRAHR
jgi:glucose/arabinose dehydrogenase/PKD repeat protein